MQEKIILVVATTEEFEALKELTTLQIIKTGVGFSNVIESLKNVSKENKLINIGFAGSNNIVPGTIVKVKNSYLHHPNVEYDEPVYNLGGDIDCYSSTDFVLKTNISTPAVFDMELNAICALGFNVEAYKVVSDSLSLKEYEKFEFKDKLKEILKGIRI